jgi:PAS domain-containing protein
MNLNKQQLTNLIDREFTVLDLLDDACFLVAISDTKGYFVSVNKAWEKITGFTKNELCSKPWMYFLHKDDVQKSMKQYYEGELFRSNAEPTEGFSNRYKTKFDKCAKLEWYSTGQNINGLNLAIAIFKGYEQPK